MTTCPRCQQETISIDLCSTCRFVAARDAGLVAFKPSRAPYREARWQQTDRATARLLAERGLPVLLEYAEFWSTPSGGKGVDVGYCEIRNSAISSKDRTWTQHAPMGDLSVVFGQATGSISYYLSY